MLREELKKSEDQRTRPKTDNEEQGKVDSMIKTLVMLGRSHPFPVQRMGELDRWIGEGSYERVLAGDYPRRSQDPEPDLWGAWRESVGVYADGVKTSTEDVGRWFRSTGGQVADRAGSAWSRFRQRGDAPDPGSGSPPIEPHDPDVTGGVTLGDDGVIDVEATEATEATD